MKSLKVVQLFETYGEFYQPYIPPVIEALRAIPNLIIEVDAYKKGLNNTVNYIPGYYHRRLKESFYNLFNSHKSKLNYVERKYLKNKIDIVHIQHSFLHKKVKGLLEIPKSERPKIVITLRGADTYLKPWRDKHWKGFYNSYGQEVDAFITMSQHQKNYMKKWGIDASKIHVIPISYGQPFDISKRSVDPNEIKIISAFRMCWEKNIEGNIRVVKHLDSKGIKVVYSIYGSGKDASQVPYLIDKYNLKHCVFYKGDIANDALKSELKHHDFYLQLSHSESLGMSVIEAQTLGLPAIVSDSDGLPEVVQHNQTGYNVKPYDVEEASEYIEMLWKNPKLYREFSQAAIINSQTKYSISKEVELLQSLYQSLTNS